MSNNPNEKPTKSKKVYTLTKEEAEKLGLTKNSNKKSIAQSAEKLGINPKVVSKQDKPTSTSNAKPQSPFDMRILQDFTKNMFGNNISFDAPEHGDGEEQGEGFDEQSFKDIYDQVVKQTPMFSMVKNFLPEDQLQSMMKNAATNLVQKQEKPKTSVNPTSSSQTTVVEKEATVQETNETTVSKEETIPQNFTQPNQPPSLMDILGDLARKMPGIAQNFKFNEMSEEEFEKISEEIEEEEKNGDKADKAEKEEENSDEKKYYLANLFTNQLIALMNFLIDKAPKMTETYRSYINIICEMAKIDPLKPLQTWKESIEGHEHIFRACTPENIDEMKRYSKTDFFLKMLMFEQNWPEFSKDKTNIQTLWNIFGGMMTTTDLFSVFPNGFNSMMMEFAMGMFNKTGNNLNNIGTAINQQIESMQTDKRLKRDILKVALKIQKDRKPGSQLDDDKVDKIYQEINVRRNNLV